MENRVVITGLGVISCAGSGIDDNWSNIVEGKSGIGDVTLCDSEIFPVKIAAEVKDFKPKDYINDRKSLKIMYRNVKLGLAAARLALDDSGVDIEKVDPLRFGAFIGSGGCGFDEGPDNKDLAEVIKSSWDEKNGKFDSLRFGADGLGRLYPLWLLKTLCNNVFCYISIYYNVQGVNDNVVNSFTSGSQSIGDGYNAIKRGDADLVFSGGYDSLVMPNNFFCYNSFNMLTGSDGSHTSFRPFDKRRDGFVLGEGAGMVILEELSHAKKRGAKIYGEIVGYGTSANSHFLCEPEQDSAGIKQSIKMACKKAGINLSDIGYINADGIGTIGSDKAETDAIKEVFTDNADKIVVSSTKPVTGHTGAAAGAIELIICAKAIEEGIVPPTINLEEPDEDCDLDYCPQTARKKELKAALSINQGVGGQNSALIVKKYEE